MILEVLDTALKISLNTNGNTGCVQGGRDNSCGLCHFFLDAKPVLEAVCLIVELPGKGIVADITLGIL